MNGAKLYQPVKSKHQNKLAGWTMTDTQNEKLQLIAKRDELRARLQSIEKDYRQGLDADSEEQALQLENAEVLEGIAKSTAEELRHIEEQLTELE
jgi:hypothetical protein